VSGPTFFPQAVEEARASSTPRGATGSSRAAGRALRARPPALAEAALPRRLEEPCGGSSAAAKSLTKKKTGGVKRVGGRNRGQPTAKPRLSKRAAGKGTGVLRAKRLPAGWAIPKDKRRWVAKLTRALDAEYGRPQPWDPKSPLDELLFTLLSQNTNDTNRDRAWASLRAAFPRLEEILAADVAEVERAIAVGGLHAQKARRMQAILRRVQAERGRLDLDHLRDATDDEARAYLMSFDGIGPKTTECVLLFSLGRPAFPVDTHIDRVSRRLGLLPARVSTDEAHTILRDLVPPEDRFAFHLNLIAHGRKTCKAPTPLCNTCSVRALCRRRLL